MPAHFVDASVFVHAYLKPRRELRPQEAAIKKRARAIVTRISKGEQVLLSTVHFAEIANLLEDWMALSEAQTILLALATMENIRILPVTRSDLVEALDLATERDVGTTDALAVILMQTEATREIYSFDRDYDRFNEIRRVDA
ncbi:MAG TPA: type II toxin-antitoxin system VapC family toxin [Thermoplasmata archaeon]|nr:type II toxin-antitoxin system VapC family toxin [Thermoplasmata archaeon]